MNELPELYSQIEEFLDANPDEEALERLSKLLEASNDLFDELFTRTRIDIQNEFEYDGPDDFARPVLEEERTEQDKQDAQRESEDHDRSE